MLTPTKFAIASDDCVVVDVDVAAAEQSRSFPAMSSSMGFGTCDRAQSAAVMLTIASVGVDVDADVTVGVGAGDSGFEMAAFAEIAVVGRCQIEQCRHEIRQRTWHATVPPWMLPAEA